MARKLVLWMCFGVALAWARPGPREIPLRPPPDPSLCAGCDCLKHNCFTPGCECSLPINGPWCEIALQRIQTLLVGSLGERLKVSDALRVQLVDPSELARYGEGDGVQGLYADGLITVNRLLSRKNAIVVLAHEYGHAWQSCNHPGYDEVDGALREGFAEWIALQALKRFGEATGGEALRSNRDPIYGGGLRWFLQVERNFGREAVFEQATTWLDPKGRRLPPVAPKKVPERKHDDSSVPDDMSEPDNSSSDR